MRRIRVQVIPVIGHKPRLATVFANILVPATMSIPAGIARHEVLHPTTHLEARSTRANAGWPMTATRADGHASRGTNSTNSSLRTKAQNCPLSTISVIAVLRLTVADLWPRYGCVECSRPRLRYRELWDW